MKKILVAGLVLGAITMAVSPAAAQPAWSWTGFYGGGNVGYGWGYDPSTFTETETVTRREIINTATLAGAAATDPMVVAVTASTGTALGNMNGWLGGVQGGYNWQTGWWVFGFETDFQWTGQSGGGTFCATAGCPAGSLYGTNTTSLPWFGTVRGRIGATSEPTPWGPIFIYLTGGLAYGQVNGSYTQGVVGGLTGTVNVNSTRAGWVFGGGGEARLGTTNWTMKAEILYIDFGNISGSTGATLGPVTTLIDGGTLTTTTTLLGNASTHVTDAIFRIGFNYRVP